MSITFQQYQEQTAETAIYPGAGTGSTEAVVYLALGLSEVGEIFQHLGAQEKDEPLGEAFHAELGDLAWYVSQFYLELRAAVGEVTTEGSRTNSPVHGAVDICIFVSEIQGIVKKTLRDGGGLLSHRDASRILDHLDLVIIAVARLAEVTGTTLGDVLEKNLAKLADRKTRGVLGGSGDKR